jgi:uncharacterized cofD-like protein
MKKVVVIGGGTGSYTVLRGLKKHDLDITAVISMFDSGGSSGRLRDEFGILPPGDVRRALIALAEDSGDLRRLFEYRFEQKKSPLHKHSFGNLILTALTDIYQSDAEAIRAAAKVLKVKGKVLPVSVTNTHLCAELENGQVIIGEENIGTPQHDDKLKIKRLSLLSPAQLYPETRQAILDADLIIIAPGQLYGSLIPNLLVSGMPEALAASKAKKVFVCNLMTQWGQTNDFTAADHARELLHYAPELQLDCIICNKKLGGKELLDRYAEQKSFPVKIDDAIKTLAKSIIVEDLITEPDLIRHDSEKLAKVLITL